MVKGQTMNIFSSPLLPAAGECISMDDDWLFHYTKAESFFPIIQSLTLKTSRLGNLNDLNEIDYSTYSQLSVQEMIIFKEYIEKRCSIACFSHHSLYSYREGYYKIVPGCCIPSMWAHYADNVSGVCLCLSRKKLLAENQAVFGDNIELRDVRYDVRDPYLKENSADLFLKNNKHNLFFIKDASWKSESEVRLLLSNIDADREEPKISIANSLDAIVFSQKFWERNKSKFIEELIRPNSFLREMCPINWLWLTQHNIAYDAGPGFPLFLEEELKKTKKDITSYVHYAKKRFNMTFE